jgi:GxxExxY protein
MRKRLKEAADRVQKEMGAGWSESIYHSSLERELSERGIAFHSEGTIPVMYKGVPVGRRRPDMFLPTDEGLITVELKAGSSTGRAQLLQYLQMVDVDHNFPDLRGGAVIRFNETVEFEFIELGPDGNPDDRQSTLEDLE